MKTAPKAATAGTSLLLGLECGGTHTVALLAQPNGTLVRRVEEGPANLRLTPDAGFLRILRRIRQQVGIPVAIGAGVAGARSAEDRARVQGLLARVWPGVPSTVNHDLASALAASEPAKVRRGAAAPGARIIVLAGTGSCTYGRTRRGRVAKVGGWGHQLGDRGSGYDIGMGALRQIIEDFDRFEEWSVLAAAILRSLQLNDPEQLIGWTQAATKADIAALAPVVFESAAAGSRDARELLNLAAMSIAADAVMCAQRLRCRGLPVEFVFSGSIFTRQEAHVRRVVRWIRGIRRGPSDRFTLLTREPAWGGVQMAREALAEAGPTGRRRASSRLSPLPVNSVKVELPVATATSPTELRNPRSLELDRLPVAEAIDLFLDEDATLAGAVRTQRDAIANLVGEVVKALRRGGRLFYVGAGTSGRLGVLDASECPPTFRTPPEWVQGIIAGGATALWSAVEGAEDDPVAGVRALAFRKLTSRDVVVGIAASGRTPFVWGALSAAHRTGAATALVCCNPHLRFPKATAPDVVIAPDLGPELLTGSTRLKSGTATKLILNLVTTLAMVQMGKVVSNLMVDLNPSNTKLRDRAARIVVELTGCDYAAAWAALESSHWVVTDALRTVRR